MKNVIGKVTTGLLLLLAGATLQGQGLLEKKIDSLFVIASSGEVKFQHLVKPAEDSIAGFGAQSVPHLVDKLETKSPRERLAVINILKKIGSPAVPYLVTALGFNKGLVVERVAWALGDIKDTAATVGLLGVAAHQRWQVREQTISALGRIGDARGADAIVTALEDTIPLVRKSATVSAGQLGLAPAIPRLVHLLGDSFYGVRMTALASLAQLDTAQVLQAVIDSLGSENRMIGDLGCNLLGRLKSDSAKHVLIAQTTSEDPERRAHAAVALVLADPTDECDFREPFLAAETDRFTRLKVESAIVAVNDGPSAKSQ
jgi:HEAT repeat protein